MFKRYNELLSESIYQGHRYETNMRTLTFGCMVISIIPIIMSIMNFAQSRVTMGISTVVMVMLLWFASLVCGKFRNRELTTFILAAVSVVMFSLYTINGRNDGFAVLWTLIAPITLMFFANVRLGIAVGIYFEILLIVLFYTPLRSFVSEYYTETFMLRFPVLYTCYMLSTSAAMIQYHVSTLYQINYEEKLESEVESKTRDIELSRRRLEIMSEQTITCLARTIDAKDNYTNGHSFRVSMYSEQLAQALRLSADDCSALRYEGLLHDIGKISIPDAVLNKKGKLTDDEYATIKNHTSAGYFILQSTTAIPGAAITAKYHHERWDGKGYPEGLKGEDIPLHARILAIADAYDAMTSNRVYRNALTDDTVIKELENGCGTQFDPKLCELFIKLVKTGKISAN